MESSTARIVGKVGEDLQLVCMQVWVFVVLSEPELSAIRPRSADYRSWDLVKLSVHLRELVAYHGHPKLEYISEKAVVLIRTGDIAYRKSVRTKHQLELDSHIPRY